jgi:hypothetical protein
VSDFENLSTLETTVKVHKVSYFDFSSLVYFVESGILFVLSFLFGFVNYSNKPRIKTTCFTILVVLGFIGWEIYAYLNDVQNIAIIVFLGLTLLSLFYIMIAGLRKGNVLNYFKKVKDDVYYEYCYQKMFARPSVYWAGRFDIKAEKRRRIWFKNFQNLGFKDKVPIYFSELIWL